ncbi:hypothetical protein [Flavobacterium sp.]|uniref:hypothetical protein n=1 Tax=Flavobacterium sp. TaxID=239 RepID=UPI00286E2411|nr:hypothetical protein [Flavobacterium sp.]
MQYLLFVFNLIVQKKNFTTQVDDLIYKNGEQKIVLEILNNQKYLKENVVEKIKVKCENIKTEKLSFSGKWISFYKTNEDKKNELFLNINLNDDEAKVSRNYELIISYHDDNINFSNKFIIPIKKQ